MLRKEDDRFLRGRGQYVGDIRLSEMQDVAFVRSPLARARITAIHIPPAVRDRVFVAGDLDCARSGRPERVWEVVSQFEFLAFNFAKCSSAARLWASRRGWAMSSTPRTIILSTKIQTAMPMKLPASYPRK